MQELIKNKLLNMNLKMRLILSFTIIAIIPTMMVGFLTYYISARYIYNITKSYTSSNMDVISNEIENIFKKANDICNSISHNVNFQEYIRKDFLDISEQYSYDLKGSMDLMSMYSNTNDIFGVYVIGENGGAYKSNSCSFRTNDFRLQEWYHKTINSNEERWFAPHVGSFIAKTVEENYISVGIPIIDKADGQAKGITMVDIEASQIIQLLDSYKKDNCGLVLVDTNSGEIVLNSSFLDEKFLADFQNTKFNNLSKDDYEILGEKYIVNKYDFTNVNWTIYSVISSNNLKQNATNIAIITFLIIVISLFIIINFIIWNADNITKPIHELSKLMNEVEEGNMNVSISIAGTGEIAKLSNNFNFMIKRICTLTDRIYEEQENIRKAEMKALQAQINPHFIYNSLDSIIWLLRLGKPDNAIEMLTALVKLFKIALSKGNEFISVKDELCHAENYLKIQKIRYNSKFDYKVLANENTYKYRTIKLILQPLIENAIYHGLGDENESEDIIIKIAEEDDRIIFSVKDTGCGINEIELEHLLKSIKNGQEEVSVSYGLKNIYERLDIYYKGNADINIYSSKAEGTQVIISIPKELIIMEELI